MLKSRINKVSKLNALKVSSADTQKYRAALEVLKSKEPGSRTEGDIELLDAVLRHCDEFATREGFVRRLLCQQALWAVALKGETVIEMGERAGLFCVLLHGRVVKYAPAAPPRPTSTDKGQLGAKSQRNEPGGVLLETIYKEGQAFGDWEALRDIPSSYTYKAVSDCDMLLLRKDGYQNVLTSVKERRQLRDFMCIFLSEPAERRSLVDVETATAFLKMVPFFHCFSLLQLEPLVTAASMVELEAGDWVCVEDDPDIECAWLILKGSVTVYRRPYTSSKGDNRFSRSRSLFGGRFRRTVQKSEILRSLSKAGSGSSPRSPLHAERMRKASIASLEQTAVRGADSGSLEGEQSDSETSEIHVSPLHSDEEINPNENTKAILDRQKVLEEPSDSRHSTPTRQRYAMERAPDPEDSPNAGRRGMGAVEPVCVLEEEDVFGDWSILMGNQPRLASVRCTTKCSLMIFPVEDMAKLLCSWKAPPSYSRKLETEAAEEEGEQEKESAGEKEKEKEKESSLMEKEKEKEGVSEEDDIPYGSLPLWNDNQVCGSVKILDLPEAQKMKWAEAVSEILQRRPPNKRTRKETGRLLPALRCLGLFDQVGTSSVEDLTTLASRVHTLTLRKGESLWTQGTAGDLTDVVVVLRGRLATFRSLESPVALRNNRKQGNADDRVRRLAFGVGTVDGSADGVSGRAYRITTTDIPQPLEEKGKEEAEVLKKKQKEKAERERNNLIPGAPMSAPRSPSPPSPSRRLPSSPKQMDLGDGDLAGSPAFPEMKLEGDGEEREGEQEKEGGGDGENAPEDTADASASSAPAAAAPEATDDDDGAKKDDHTFDSSNKAESVPPASAEEGGDRSEKKEEGEKKEGEGMEGGGKEEEGKKGESEERDGKEGEEKDGEGKGDEENADMSPPTVAIVKIEAPPNPNPVPPTKPASAKVSPSRHSIRFHPDNTQAAPNVDDFVDSHLRLHQFLDSTAERVRKATEANGGIPHTRMVFSTSRKLLQEINGNGQCTLWGEGRKELIRPAVFSSGQPTEAAQQPEPSSRHQQQQQASSRLQLPQSAEVQHGPWDQSTGVHGAGSVLGELSAWFQTDAASSVVAAQETKLLVVDFKGYFKFCGKTRKEMVKRELGAEVIGTIPASKRSVAQVHLLHSLVKEDSFLRSLSRLLRLDLCQCLTVVRLRERAELFAPPQGEKESSYVFASCLKGGVKKKSTTSPTQEDEGVSQQVVSVKEEVHTSEEGFSAWEWQQMVEETGTVSRLACTEDSVFAVLDRTDFDALISRAGKGEWRETQALQLLRNEAAREKNRALLLNPAEGTGSTSNQQMTNNNTGGPKERSGTDLYLLDDLLKRSRFFDQLAPSNRFELCKQAEYQLVPQGATLFAQGDEGDALYLVLSGCTGIYVGEQQEESSLNEDTSKKRTSKFPQSHRDTAIRPSTFGILKERGETQQQADGPRDSQGNTASRFLQQPAEGNLSRPGSAETSPGKQERASRLLARFKEKVHAANSDAEASPADKADAESKASAKSPRTPRRQQTQQDTQAIEEAQTAGAGSSPKGADPKSPKQSFFSVASPLALFARLRQASKGPKASKPKPSLGPAVTSIFDAGTGMPSATPGAQSAATSIKQEPIAAGLSRAASLANPDKEGAAQKSHVNSSQTPVGGEQQPPLPPVPAADGTSGKAANGLGESSTKAAEANSKNSVASSRDGPEPTISNFTAAKNIAVHLAEHRDFLSQVEAFASVYSLPFERDFNGAPGVVSLYAPLVAAAALFRQETRQRDPSMQLKHSATAKKGKRPSTSSGTAARGRGMISSDSPVQLPSVDLDWSCPTFSDDLRELLQGPTDETLIPALATSSIGFRFARTVGGKQQTERSEHPKKGKTGENALPNAALENLLLQGRLFAGAFAGQLPWGGVPDVGGDGSPDRSLNEAVEAAVPGQILWALALQEDAKEIQSMMIEAGAANATKPGGVGGIRRESTLSAVSGNRPATGFARRDSGSAEGLSIEEALGGGSMLTPARREGAHGGGDLGNLIVQSLGAGDPISPITSPSNAQLGNSDGEGIREPPPRLGKLFPPENPSEHLLSLVGRKSLLSPAFRVAGGLQSASGHGPSPLFTRLRDFNAEALQVTVTVSQRKSRKTQMRNSALGISGRGGGPGFFNDGTLRSDGEGGREGLGGVGDSKEEDDEAAALQTGQDAEGGGVETWAGLALADFQFLSPAVRKRYAAAKRFCPPDMKFVSFSAKGQVFGERALQQNEARAATVIALEDTELLVIRKEAYKRHASQEAEKRHQAKIQRLKKLIPGAADLSDSALHKLGFSFDEIQVPKGTRLSQEGTHSNYLFLLVQGACRLLHAMPTKGTQAEQNPSSGQPNPGLATASSAAPLGAQQSSADLHRSHRPSVPHSPSRATLGPSASRSAFGKNEGGRSGQPEGQLGTAVAVAMTSASPNGSSSANPSQHSATETMLDQEEEEAERASNIPAALVRAFLGPESSREAGILWEGRFVGGHSILLEEPEPYTVEAITHSTLVLCCDKNSLLKNVPKTLLDGLRRMSVESQQMVAKSETRYRRARFAVTAKLLSALTEGSPPTLTASPFLRSKLPASTIAFHQRALNRRALAALRAKLGRVFVALQRRLAYIENQQQKDGGARTGAPKDPSDWNNPQKQQGPERKPKTPKNSQRGSARAVITEDAIKYISGGTLQDDPPRDPDLLTQLLSADELPLQMAADSPPEVINNGNTEGGGGQTEEGDQEEAARLAERMESLERSLAAPGVLDRVVSHFASACWPEYSLPAFDVKTSAFFDSVVLLSPSSAAFKEVLGCPDHPAGPSTRKTEGHTGASPNAQAAPTTHPLSSASSAASSSQRPPQPQQHTHSSAHMPSLPPGPTAHGGLEKETSNHTERERRSGSPGKPSGGTNDKGGNCPWDLQAQREQAIQRLRLRDKLARKRNFGYVETGPAVNRKANARVIAAMRKLGPSPKTCGISGNENDEVRPGSPQASRIENPGDSAAEQREKAAAWLEREAARTGFQFSLDGSSGKFKTGTSKGNTGAAGDPAPFPSHRSLAAFPIGRSARRRIAASAANSNGAKAQEPYLVVHTARPQSRVDIHDERPWPPPKRQPPQQQTAALMGTLANTTNRSRKEAFRSTFSGAFTDRPLAYRPAAPDGRLAASFLRQNVPRRHPVRYDSALEEAPEEETDPLAPFLHSPNLGDPQVSPRGGFQSRKGSLSARLPAGGSGDGNSNSNPSSESGPSPMVPELTNLSRAGRKLDTVGGSLSARRPSGGTGTGAGTVSQGGHRDASAAMTDFSHVVLSATKLAAHRQLFVAHSPRGRS
uniref:Cyclic nucleotide-binding domain-containing protein n=1 Tax=Chromera velia CCMP2878 TaxID=1169474 RepID=A0A0G4I579_9ALVE|eukprot:Cvel_11117.t1-p1 / transcript=Cvel_11117.t1 / gene=Cvel_11117 / organism=Chromera_velia_CCMP2878 / gene_product=hypothetical protein / transcript_product=hypothetical protein / location=Cvel_scaffold688:29954-45645(-) / protein_length=3312 / sequence_SO=supercontig / SO=protein_coding / is_pseudo=false